MCLSFAYQISIWATCEPSALSPNSGLPPSFSAKALDLFILAKGGNPDGEILKVLEKD